jgi:hypothetical protein
MQFRRWWSAVALFAIVLAWGADSSRAQGPTGPRPTGKEIAGRMAQATGSDAVEVRTDALKWFEPGVITSVMDRENFGKEVAVALATGPMAGTNPDAVLNSAILIANIKTASTDSVLENMLKNKDASVRYWAAKGLGENLALKGLGGVFVKQAANALNAALPTETSGLVRREILQALVTQGDADDLLQAIDSLSTIFQSAQPDQETLDGVEAVLSRFPGALSTMKNAVPPVPVPTPAKIATSMSRLASFISQQEVAMKAARAAAGTPFLGVPAEAASDKQYHQAVVDAINGAMRGLDAAAAKPGTFPTYKAEQSPEEILTLLEGVTGSAGLGPGQVQHVFSGVDVPPKIK